MKILSIDTASKLCGVAILENTNLIIQKDTITDKSHSEKLMPIIKETFDEANISLKDIDLIVCDNGPGSFTGIRIGVATTKAFSDSLNINTIGVSSLESLVYNVKQTGLVCSLIDAKNNNCYFSLYKCEQYDKDDKEITNNKTSYSYKYTQLIEPKSDSLDNIFNLLKDYSNTSIVFVGDGAINYKTELLENIPNCSFADKNLNDLNSYSLGLAGFTKFSNNVSSDVLPMYLRKPQAQRQLEEKLNGNNN